MISEKRRTDSTSASLRQALATWIVAEHPDEEITALEKPSVGEASVGGPGSAPVTWPVAAVLYELWEDPTPLPEAVAAWLGLPAGATFAHASRLIWSICDDPLFPARTHVDAVRYLAGQEPEVVHTYHRAVEQRMMRGSDADSAPPSLGEISQIVDTLTD